MEIRLKFKNGSDTIVKMLIANNTDSFLISNLADEVDSVILDPNNWILKDITEFTLNPQNITLGTIFNDTKYPIIFPNPSQNSIELKNEKPINKLLIINEIGKEFIKITDPKNNINIEKLPAGNYYIIITDSEKTSTKRFVKI